jgi:hypothetical protein
MVTIIELTMVQPLEVICRQIDTNPKFEKEDKTMKNVILSIAAIIISIGVSFPSSLIARSTTSSYPYISGDTFRAFCDHIYDEKCKVVIPDQVKYGDTIFLKTDYIGEFFEYVHPNILNPYILLTHNSDYSVPREFGYILDDPKLIAWFGQNVEGYSHPKLHPIPIGIANSHWGHGSIETVALMQKKTKGCGKNMLLYMNFSPSTYHVLRPYVFNLFYDKPFCVVSSPKDFGLYLVDVAHSKFVISPRGNGLDCHRTWEALYMGAIPIVESSLIDPLFQELPVVVINDWTEVTQEFLEAQWEEMSKTEYQLDRMYADYWFKLISSYKLPPM